MTDEVKLLLKRLIFNLFYPAILGTLFSNLLPALRASFVRGMDPNASLDWKLILCAVLVGHAIIDYTLAQEIKTYGLYYFGLDLLVVILLYAAYSLTYLGSPAPARSRLVACLLTGVYLCYLGWYHRARHEIGRQPRLVAYEIITAVLLLILAITGAATSLLALVLGAATLAMVVIGSRILREYYAAGRNLATRSQFTPPVDPPATPSPAVSTSTSAAPQPTQP
jgi:hypothetical protein